MVESVLRRLARDHWVRLHGTPRVTVLVGGERGRALWTEWLAVSGLAGLLLEGELDDRLREAVARALDEPARPIAVLVSAEAAARWRADRRDRLAALADEGWLRIDEEEPAGDAGALARRGGARAREVPIVTGSACAVRDAAQVRGSVESITEGTAAAGDGGRSVGDGGAEVRGGSPSASGDGPAASGDAALAARARPALLDARSLAEATLYEALEATPATAGRFALNASLSVRFGGQAAEIDLLARGERIAIEIDGIHHFAEPDCYRRDRRKDLLLQTQGFVVVRLLAEDVVRDVRAAVNVVCQALAYRRGEAAR